MINTTARITCVLLFACGLLCAAEREFTASFFQVFYDGEVGPDNPSYIYSEPSSIIDQVAKGKARITCLAEIKFSETAKNAAISKAVLIPDPIKDVVAGRQWGVDMQIDHIKSIPAKGPIPLPRWEFAFTLSASLFTEDISRLQLDEKRVAIKEEDVKKLTAISGKTITALSRGNPIHYMLPIGKRSIIYVRIEPVDNE